MERLLPIDTPYIKTQAKQLDVAILQKQYLSKLQCQKQQNNEKSNNKYFTKGLCLGYILSIYYQAFNASNFQFRKIHLVDEKTTAPHMLIHDFKS